MNAEKELKESKKEKVTPPCDMSGEDKPNFTVKCGSLKYNESSSACLFAGRSNGSHWAIVSSWKRMVSGTERMNVHDVGVFSVDGGIKLTRNGKLRPFPVLK